MTAIFQFVLNHGYSILFAAIFVHQIGLPIPGPLFLIAAGALVAAHKLDPAAALAFSVVACVLADWMWYEAARRGGEKVLHFIHRLTTKNPDFHDRRAKATFARYGPQLLLIAKFVPGLDAVLPPLAGTVQTVRWRFLALDAVGAGFYSCAYAGLGVYFSHDLARAAGYAARAGTFVASLALVMLCVYVVRRHRGAPQNQLNSQQQESLRPRTTD
jgi:membrane protein DedA with SNARE-associated domain